MKINLERTGMLAEGVYRLRIDSVEEMPGQSGFPYLKVTYTVLAKSGKPTENKLWDNISMSPRARFKVDQWLDALELPENGSVTVNSLRGKSLYATIIHDTFNNQKKAAVGQYITEEQASKEPEMDVPEGAPSFTPDEPAKFAPSNPMEDEDDEEEGLDVNVEEMENTDDIPF